MCSTRQIACLVAASFAVSALVIAAPVTERREVLGLRVGMKAADARKRIEAIGTFVRDERKRQQIWSVRDETFSHLIIGLDQQDEVRFVTAVARADEEAKRMRYDAVGSLEAARQAGDVKINNFNYEWKLGASGDTAVTLVIARGRHAEFLDTLSLKRIEPEQPDAAP